MAKPIATVGDIIAYLLNHGGEGVCAVPLLRYFSGVDRAARQAERMRLITCYRTLYGDLFMQWNV